jgi:hypothetical protein
MQERNTDWFLSSVIGLVFGIMVIVTVVLIR